MEIAHLYQLLTSVVVIVDSKPISFIYILASFQLCIPSGTLVQTVAVWPSLDRNGCGFSLVYPWVDTPTPLMERVFLPFPALSVLLQEASWVHYTLLDIHDDLYPHLSNTVFTDDTKFLKADSSFNDCLCCSNRTFSLFQAWCPTGTSQSIQEIQCFNICIKTNPTLISIHWTT